MNHGRASSIRLGAFTVGIWAASCSLLLWSGRTYSGYYTADILTFWDGAHRILSGQTPNLTFHYPLGPLTTYLPAVGLWIGGSLGEMMPWATVVFAAIMVPVIAYASFRLPQYTALGFIAFVLVLIIAPLVPADRVEQVSFAMFYNRWGWALLTIVGVLFLPSSRPTLDAWLVAVLVLVLAYLKITFAAVGLGLALFAFILLSERRRALAGALTAIPAAGLLIEFLWGGTAGYISDVRMAATASGALRGTLWTFGRITLENAPALMIFGLLWLAAIFRQARWEYLALSAALALAGLPLLNQSAQSAGILTIVPAALIALYAPAGKKPGYEQALFPILTVPLIVTHGLALSYHAVLSSRSHAYTLDGLAAPLSPDFALLRESYRGGDDSRHFSIIGRAVWPQPNSIYLPTILDGIALLKRKGITHGIATLDIANPFNAALNGDPPKGVDLAPVKGRTFTEGSHRASMLDGARFLMVPKSPWLPDTTSTLMQIYKVEQTYRPIAQSEFWRLYQRRS